MSEPKHTPTPWVYWPDNYTITNDVTFIHQRKVVALTSTGSESEHANAELIVRACNAHDELVAALDHIQEWIENHVPDCEGKSWTAQHVKQTLHKAKVCQ